MVFDAALNPYVERVRNHHVIAADVRCWDLPPPNVTSVLDLGCGNGHFLESLCLQEPHIFAVGVEKRFKRAFKSAEKIGRSQQAHASSRSSPARILQMNWIDFLVSTPAQVWDTIWLQFPDPWPKTRHEKNRLITPVNILWIARALKKGGAFHFRSDCLDYFEGLIALNERYRYFSSAIYARDQDLFMSAPQTLFQKKFLSKGVPIHSLIMNI